MKISYEFIWVASWEFRVVIIWNGTYRTADLSESAIRDFLFRVNVVHHAVDGTKFRALGWCVTEGTASAGLKAVSKVLVYSYCADFWRQRWCRKRVDQRLNYRDIVHIHNKPKKTFLLLVSIAKNGNLLVSILCRKKRVTVITGGIM